MDERGVWLFDQTQYTWLHERIFLKIITFLEIPKIEPTAARHSMFDEPSSGSKKTMYFPCLSVSTSITVSSSSDTKRQVV